MERLKEMMERVGEQLENWNKGRKAEAQLQKLTDAELRDIGISRSMIKHVVWGDRP